MPHTLSRPGKQGHRGTGVPPPRSPAASGVGQAPEMVTGDPSGSHMATGAQVLPMDSPTGPPCTPHPGVPRGPYPRPHRSPLSHHLNPGRVPVRQHAGCGGRGGKPSFHILPVFFLCHTSFFFFPPFPPPSSQKGWFSSESLKHICIPKTSLGINSSQCRGLFLFFFPPYPPDFLPFFFSLQT